MLTKECANCPWWVDTETACGCSRPTPINDCEAYTKEYESDEELEDFEDFYTDHDDWYDEVGYNPYMGCYDFDC